MIFNRISFHNFLLLCVGLDFDTKKISQLEVVRKNSTKKKLPEKTEKTGKNLKNMSHLIGIDLGATNAKAAVVTKDGKVIANVQESLGKDLSPKAVVSKLVKCASDALKEIGMYWNEIAGVGVGSPGGIDSKKGIVIKSANLFPGCSNIPLCEMISRHTNGTPVTLVNDADAAILAEKWIGVGRKYDDLVFMTLGSGIGVGIVVNEQVVSGMTGTIEGGHHIIVAGGRPCTCGSRGCLEAYVSANSVVRRTKEALTLSSSQSSLNKLLDKITCKDVFAAAESDDPLAKKIVVS